jgi:hypothetical protein
MGGRNRGRGLFPCSGRSTLKPTLVLSLACVLLSWLSACDISTPAGKTSGPTGIGDLSRRSARTEWQGLRRPLQRPSIGPGMPCPKTEGRRAEELTAGITARLSALGIGPVYPVLAGPIVYKPNTNSGPHAVVHFVRQPGSRWSAIKTLWIAPRKFQGRVLIRGWRVDGNDPVRFDGEEKLRRELRLETPGGPLWSPGGPAIRGWQHWTSAIRLVSRGCYGLQMDGEDFTATVVFRAGPWRH